ncbi:MAG: hypothetical protein RR537_06690 [Longicatena sp.]
MNYTVIIVFVVTAIVCLFVTQYVKQRTIQRLLKDLREGNFEDYFKTLDSFLCKYFYPPFNREYMRLNAFVMQGLKKKVEEQFDLLLTMRMNKKQEIDVVVKAFYYYIDEENKTKTSELLTRMKNMNDESISNECQIVYDIFIEKETKYIDTMNEQLKDKDCTGINRGMFNYFLAIQYANMKEHKKEIDCLEKALTDLKGTPYEIRINNMLK